MTAGTRFAIAVAVVACLSAAAAGPAGADEEPGACVIVIGGKEVTPATHAIAVPAEATPQEQFAAKDLADHLERMSGGRLEVWLAAQRKRLKIEAK